jgi:xanthine dehydrogenase iron-sulfur cluster and FAD-binding subunit A
MHLWLSLRDDDPDAVVHAPVGLLELLELKRCLPRAKLFSGNIDHTAISRRDTTVWLSTHRVTALQRVDVSDGVLEVGASVMMSSFLERASVLQDSTFIKMVSEQILASFTPQVRIITSIK